MTTVTDEQLREWQELSGQARYGLDDAQYFELTLRAVPALIAALAEARVENGRLISAWMVDETIQADGSLRPSVPDTVARAAAAEAAHAGAWVAYEEASKRAAAAEATLEDARIWAKAVERDAEALEARADALASALRDALGSLEESYPQLKGALVRTTAERAMRMARRELAPWPAAQGKPAPLVRVPDAVAQEYALHNGWVEVHRSWRDNMLAHGREVAPERMDSRELSLDDVVLDQAIALDVVRDFLVWVSDPSHYAQPGQPDAGAGGGNVKQPMECGHDMHWLTGTADGKQQWCVLCDRDALLAACRAARLYRKAVLDVFGGYRKAVYQDETRALDAALAALPAHLRADLEQQL